MGEETVIDMSAIVLWFKSPRLISNATPSVLSDIYPKHTLEIKNNYPIFFLCIWGEPIESHDRDSLEGVGETRLTTGTIYTDKLFTV